MRILRKISEIDNIYIIKNMKILEPIEKSILIYHKENNQLVEQEIMINKLEDVNFAVVGTVLISFANLFLITFSKGCKCLISIQF